MPNPFDINYLTEVSAAFGPYAWVFYILQAIGFALGMYLVFAWKDTNAVRKRAFRQLGLALLVAGGVGLALGLLRLSDVAIFNQRFWFHLWFLAEIILAAYIVYYARTTYPKKLAESQRKPRRAKASAQPSRAGTPAARHAVNGADDDNLEDAAFPQTGRRESRRARKRKKR
jgi:hypothetical protein